MRYIQRILSKKLHNYLKLFPVVVIIGPRQSGKTTFIKKELPRWRYFDMEKPSDYRRLSGDIEFFLHEYGKQCIIDEAQEIPPLFPALRSYIDLNRDRKGQIVLLGSVNPRLIENISESLAGRVGFLELYPFNFSEIKKILPIQVEDFWLRGGYPEPITWKESEHGVWIENYIKTFVERDIFKVLKTSFSAQKQTQLLSMIAHLHGKVLNASQIAGAFGVSYHTVSNYIDLLENYFLIHKLLPYHVNIGKRLIKRPKLYFRDTGLLHYLLHISSKEDLRVSPYRGFSFEGFVIESLIQQVLIHKDVQCRFYYYRTAQGDEIDLLMHRGDTLIAYEMKTSTSVDMHEIKGFIRCLDQLKIKRGIIVYFGKEDYKVNSRIEVKSVYNLF